MAKAAVSKKPAAAKAAPTKPARKPKTAAIDRAPVFTVGLNQLRYGHDKGAPVEGLNSRVTDRKGALQELVASIRAVGLVAPLAVAEGASGFWYVIDGNRRLAALRQVAKLDKLPDDHPVEVRRVDDNLFEASLAANVVRAPMHPVDQFEAFARMHAEGKTVGDIAARFGLHDRTVQQRLALGRLHPTIRAAWRAEEISAEQAQAFTLTEDQDKQAKVFAELQANDRLAFGAIRTSLAGTVDQESRFVRFVGLDAYRAAGGSVATDLFEDVVLVLDTDILDRLVREKIDAVCQELIGAGWAWAKYQPDADESKLTRVWKDERAGLTADETARLQALTFSNATWAADQQARQAILALGRERSFTDEERAGLGCLVSVSWEGELQVDHGYGDRKAATKVPDDPDEKQPAGEAPESSQMIPHALAQSLSAQLTDAATEALAADPTTALRVAVAAFMQRYRGPARLTASGRNGANYAQKADTFEEAYRRLEGLDETKLIWRMAEIVAGSLDLTVEGCARDNVKSRDNLALIAALDQERLQQEALGLFNAAEYFAKATSKAAIAALVDIDGRNSCISKKKADIAALAAIKAKEAGWLPPELRGPGYTGPGSKPATAEAAE